MSDEALGLLAAVIGVAVGVRVVKASGRAVGSGLKTVGSGIGAALNSAAEESLRNSAFEAGLNGQNRPRMTRDTSLNDELERSYEAGYREHELRVNAMSRIVSLNASETHHYVRDGRDD
ncbi:hypothetical protein P1X14_16810 [Sphingomonas sp. AOB5]|uniref:hypothetical protein n=1 Tax=Sphingomonas sp. AOB5 TaxID=3034017 RepID=UPI0023F72206|nr:hypothetical protein [Sphingomonas sp. AOB5]MDF7776921.1 hypothetical protein [Sphingomonas sp. AOB5]